MRKKMLVKEAGFIDFIKSFFGAKSKGKEREWISSLRKVNPDLADSWKRWDDSIDHSLKNMRKIYVDLNMSDKVAYIDDLIAKRK
jgi:hypothetical protein